MKFTILVLLLVFIATFYVYTVETSPEIRPIDNHIQSTVIVHIGEYGHASGVYISPHCILTAAHVVEDYDGYNGFISVFTPDGTQRDIRQIVIDYDDDLAFVYTEEPSSAWSKLGSISAVLVGDDVLLVCTPLDRSNVVTLTKGIVSHLDRRDTGTRWKDTFQIDAWGAPGCSGGPVFHNDKLVGICVALMGSRSGSGLIYCEPVDDIDHWLRSK